METQEPALPLLGRSKRLREQVYEVLRNQILQQELEPGFRLVEEVLASQLGVSRTPVREALQSLAIEGLVTDSSVRGYEVAPLGSREIEGALEIRRLLECYAARRAAMCITPQQLETLRDICNQENGVVGEDSFIALGDALALNRRFHSEVVASAANETLTLVVGLLQRQIAYTVFPLGSQANHRLFAASHRRLVERLAEHDADGAEAEAAYHIDLAKKVLSSQKP